MSDPAQKFDPALIDNLSPEERAALEGVDEQELAAGLAPAPADPPAGSDDDDDDGSGDDDAAAVAAPTPPAPAPAPAAAAEAAPVAPAVAAEPAAPAQAPQPAPAPPAPVFVFKLPDDFEQRKSALAEKEAGIWQRFDDGEISREEMRTELDRLNAERTELNNLALKADLARDMQQQTAEQMRQQEINGLFARAARPENGGIDYAKDPAKLADLDGFLKVLAANDANEDKPLQWFLDEAHKRVCALHGIRPAAASAPDPAKAKAEALARREPDLAGVRASLSQVPGGQGNGDVGGEFDDILALDGEAYEDALLAMQRTNPGRFARFQAAQQL